MPAKRNASILRKKLVEEGSVDAERALDYLSEVGDENERSIAKFDMARIACPPWRC